MPSYKQIILSALSKVVSEQGYKDYVNRDIHEQALAHRLAFHLENSGFFVGYNIDCEYNRHGYETKRDSRDNPFRPDILIHVRGNDDSNFIMIETKKFNDPSKEKKKEAKSLSDRKEAYGYRYAFLVIFPEEKITGDLVKEI